MCAGALLQARVGTVVYGARNTLAGNISLPIPVLSAFRNCANEHVYLPMYTCHQAALGCPRVLPGDTS
jgi:tRNA(Arg) A34 adenosine deaminase TadA